MIVSASRRTDLPAFHADWLCRRFSEGSVLVKNPYNAHRAARVPLTPDAVDGIVFWTKNPLPLARRLSLFDPYPYYFQWTLTPYGRDIEPGLPEKARLLAAFRELSARIGPLRLVWRYDPVLISPAWTAARHAETFAAFCASLAGACDTCVVSFLDRYRHRERILRALAVRPPNDAERETLLRAFTKSAARYGFDLRACCEAGTGLPPAACVDAPRLEAIAGVPFARLRDPYQRGGCACAPSVDIGAYNTCPGGCVYCYAVRAPRAVRPVPPDAPCLGGPVTAADIVTERPMPRLRRPAPVSLFSSDERNPS